MSWGWRRRRNSAAARRLTTRTSVCVMMLAIHLCAFAASAGTLPRVSPQVRPEVIPASPRVIKPLDIDRAAFEAFVDHFIMTHMERDHVPGVVFYMVKDGREFMAKGYGYANLERKTPMDPRRTVLAAGSLTKLFTATACMQLVDAGKLDLFADINTYLTAFKIEERAEPVTLAHLLEHTDGFDVMHIGVAARNASELMPLETYLARHMPPRVRPPGMSAVYGEHGMALAGYLIQVVTGVPYEDYMRTHLLAPLGMQRSDFTLRSDMQEHVSVAYRFERGRFVPVTPEFAYHIVPAAGLYATAEDLGAFMLAHLNDGMAGEHRIFSPHTADLMRERKFGLHPMLSAWSYGFHSRMHAGEICIEHGGMSLRSVCQMLIMPERNLGFVIAGNGLAMSLHKDFLSAFLNHFFGPRVGAPTFDVTAPGVIDANRFAGWYEALHRSVTSLERLSDLTRQTLVEVTSPTTLRTNSQQDHVDWVRIAPDVYECTSGEARIAFVHDQDDNVVAMLNGPHECARLPWWASVPVQRGCFAALTIVFALAPLTHAAAWVRRRIAGAALGARQRLAALAALAMCVMNAVFIVGLARFLHTADHLEFVFGLPAMMRGLLWLPMVTTVLAPAVAGFTLAGWMDHEGSVLRRVHDSIVALAGLGFIALAAHWNLLAVHEW